MINTHLIARSLARPSVTVASLVISFCLSALTFAQTEITRAPLSGWSSCNGPIGEYSSGQEKCNARGALLGYSLTYSDSATAGWGYCKTSSGLNFDSPNYSFHCPAGFALQNYTQNTTCGLPYTRGQGTNVSCTRSAGAVDVGKTLGACTNGTCGIGNPINFNPSLGNKYQVEVDYSASTGTQSLAIQRTYNSQNLPDEEAPLRPAAANPWHFGKNWRGNYDISIKFTTLASLSTAAALRPDGKILAFTLINGAWTPDSDISDKLVRLADGSGNPTGWQLTRATDDAIEAYDINGALISVITRTGYTQSLTYSDTSTPTSIAPRAGLLIRITDSFGRQINYAYDSANRVVAVTDPSGGIYGYGYDTNNNLISVTHPDSKVRNYVYGELANTANVSRPNALTGIIDENNNRFATYKYNSSGSPVSTEHASGVEKYSFAYGGSPTVTDALGKVRTLSFQTILGVPKYTGSSDSCQAPGCSNLSKSVNYDINGNVSQQTDFNGNITKYSYNLTRNLETSRTEAYGTAQARTITTIWHSMYRLPTLITEPGKTTAFTYDANGNLLSKTITDTALNISRAWSYTYNSLGQMLTVDGPRTDVSDITTHTYYATTSAGNYTMGDLAAVTDTLGHVTAITKYDANGRPLSITDPNGVITTLTYSPRGWLTSRSVGTQTTSYTYDGVGQLTKVTLPDASYLSYTYDTAHRLTDITDNTGNKIHYVLDAIGNRTAENTYDPSSLLAKTRSRVFDSLNRLQKDIGGTSPTTQITQYGYDNNGNLKTITDPLNHITTNGYDALNRLITITDPANGVATNTYNALDQLTQVKDPRNLITQYTSDALGNLKQTQSPDSGTTQNTYDAAGNVAQKTDARGVVSNYTYDALNRVTSITYPANTAENVSFTYDSTANGNKGIGKLTGYSNNGGATVLMYDSLGNVVQQTEMIGSQFYVTAFQYDSANRLAQTTYSSGRIVTYTRNALGQITQVQTQDAAGGSTTTLASAITYKPFGPISSLGFANGVTTSLQYDADYRVSRITATTNPAWDFSYSYDAAGNITGISDLISSYSKGYGYDALNRVTSDSNNAAQWGYQYDANGNRTQRSITQSGSTTTQTPSYATTSNKLTQLDGSSATEDATGNLTALGIKGYTYNNANRLMAYSENGATKATFAYNALGKRTQKTGTLTTHYRYALDGKVIATKTYNTDGSTNQEVEYIWLDDMPVAQIQSTYTGGTIAGTRTTYIHADHLNTPRAMSDSTQAIVWRWDGDAYGYTQPNNNPDGDGTIDNLALRFSGQWADSETGLSMNGFREYDAGLGRYTLQADPIGLNGGSWSPFAYTNNNPNSFTDPTGLWFFAPAIPAGLELLSGAINVGAATGITAAANKIISKMCPDDKPCPPCKTVSGKIVPVGTVGYRPLDVIPDDVKQHGVYGSHHNIFVAKQYPSPKCDCFWQKQNYVLKPWELPTSAIPIEPFAN